MACKQVDPHDICEECPEWIFTLADLIMCMMGLFVILWVLKPEGRPPTGGGSAQTAGGQQAQNAPSLEEAIAAIRGAFGYEPDPNSTDPIDRALIMQRLRAHRPGDGERGHTFKPADGAEGTDHDVTTIRLGPQAAIGGPVQFDAGSVELSPPMRRQLEQIASLVRGHRNVILVKGHTSADDLPDDATSQQLLDLSIRRAQAVADYLVSQGVSPDTVRVLGCSTFEPVRARGYSAEQQALNRRVEVEVTASIVEQFQDRPRGQPLKSGH